MDQNYKKTKPLSAYQMFMFRLYSTNSQLNGRYLQCEHFQVSYSLELVKFTAIIFDNASDAEESE